MKVITTKICSTPPTREKKTRNGQSCKHSSSIVSNSSRVANAGDCWHLEVSGDSCSFLELHGMALGAPQTQQLIY